MVDGLGRADMADIFLSYNRADQAVARRFADAFKAQGFEVWWDSALRAGETYDQVTDKALREAKAVVVLWSKKSVESNWVRAEASIGQEHKHLAPVKLVGPDGLLGGHWTQARFLPQRRCSGVPQVDAADGQAVARSPSWVQ